MRYSVWSCLVFAACGGSSAARTGGHDGNDLGIIADAAADASGSFDMLPADVVDGDDFIGVRFTTTTARTITCLGAAIYNPTQSSPDVTMLMAIVPLDPTTHLPITTDLSDAVGYTSGVIPFYPPSTIPAPPTPAMFGASIALPAGTWGLVVASDRLGVPYHEGWLPITNVTPVGSPSYFHYTESGDTEQTPGTWIDGLNADNVRFFVMAN